MTFKKLLLLMCGLLLSACVSSIEKVDDTKPVVEGDNTVVASGSTISVPSWNSYHNASAKLSFRYPAGWHVSEENTAHSVSIRIESSTRKAEDEALRARYKANSGSWQSWVPIQLSPEIGVHYKNFEEELHLSDDDTIVRSMTVGNLEGVLILNQTMGDYYYFVANKNGSNYSIGFDPADIEKSPYKDILDSFTVLDSERI